MPQKRNYIVKVALGSIMSNKAVENEDWFKSVTPDGNEIVEHTFSTSKEVSAFISGMELMNGWSDECHTISFASRVGIK